MEFPRSSARAGAAPSAAALKSGAALALVAALAACATESTQPSRPPPPSAPASAQVQTREGVTPPFMAGRRLVRVGLLLPFSQRPQDADGLYKAAELALFDHGDQNTLLMPRDAGADAASAQAAAQALIHDGADVIIGPILRDGVQGAGQAARAQHVPVIGFSSDRTVGGNGVYLLSFQPEDEIHRLVDFAVSRNVRTIALLAPANEYGRRVQSALQAEAQARGITITAAQLYNRTDAEAGAAAGQVIAAISATPTQAILIADNGTPLRAIGSALARAHVDPQHVHLLGTSAWAGGDAQREPTLAGGWYVSTDLGARTDFEQRYQALYQREPTRLASLGYDAVALATALSRAGGAQALNGGALENGEGFLGSDGIFRFHRDGSIERGLAIMEVRPTGSVVIDPAPRRFPGPQS